MLLIYTHKITPRFTYIMKQIFTRILGVDISFATKVEDFIKHTGPKITYTKQPLQNEFFVRSNNLLFEQGINNVEVVIEDWEGVPCFFSSGESSSVPFDIFSASFYMLSRYEEYLPTVKDEHGRFSPKDSIAYKNNFLEIPVVDFWAYKLLELLEKRFPELKRNARQYQYSSVIDVTSSHCFALRSFVRNGAGFFLDLFSLQLRRLGKRISVWFDSEKDPFNNFTYLINLHKKYNIQALFFFQFAIYSTYDKNISTNNNKFQFLIKSIADYSMVSLSASYSSFNNLTLLKKEKKDLAAVVNRPINYSRTRYNRIDVPETYQNLIAAEFTDDFTMGYTHEIGFRAGTCSTFYFYDINLELQQPIRVHPFAIHDYAFVNAKKIEVVIHRIEKISGLVKKVNGNFITIFSNELLGGSTTINWMKLYTQILKNNNE